MPNEKYTIQAISDGLDVFFSLCSPKFKSKTIREIEEELHLGSNKIYRILSTLEQKEMVKKDAGGRWAVASGLVKISAGFNRFIAEEKAELERMVKEYRG